MTAVSFHAWRGDRYIDAASVLDALGPPAHGLVWRVAVDEMAPGDERLLAASPPLPTAALRALVGPEVQIIDGALVGFDGDAQRVLVRAVDSSWWDVESEDEELIARIRAAFPDAIEFAP
jgi:hypothetical protein